MRRALFAASFVLTVGCSGSPNDEATDTSDEAAVDVNFAKPIYADYGGALRRSDGHIDTQAMIARLKALHVNTYAYLIWGWRYKATPFYQTDFADFQNEFLPAAEKAGIDVWAYLPSPLEMKMFSPAPFHADYPCWGDRIGTLAAAHKNLKAIVIDDFFSKPNLPTFTEEYTAKIRASARAHAPTIDFVPIAYFTSALLGLLGGAYASSIDGVIFVNLNRSIADTNQFLPDELAQMNRVIRSPVTSLDFHVPKSGDLSVGQSISLSHVIDVGQGTHEITFGEGDDLFARGPGLDAIEGADGTRMIQLLVNGNKAWEHDLNAAHVPGETPGFQRRSVNIDNRVTPGKQATITFRAIATGAHAGVPDIDVDVYDVGGTGFTMAPSAWTVNQTGAAFGAKAIAHKYHAKVVLMTYASTVGTWNPDTTYIVQSTEWGHARIPNGQLDGVITYQLDKVNIGGGTTFAELAARYPLW